jgi:NADP-dependent 3-hydroxy acid dehydrogenase YdfG
VFQTRRSRQRRRELVVAQLLGRHAVQDSVAVVAAAERARADELDIADGILFSVTRPPRASVNEILIRPSGQER